MFFFVYFQDCCLADRLLYQFEFCRRLDYDRAVERLYHEVRELEGSHDRPIIKVDTSFLDFGKIRYLRRKQGQPVLISVYRFDSRQIRKITIENVGKVKRRSCFFLSFTKR